MNNKQKKALYESIMKNVSKQVRSAIDEGLKQPEDPAKALMDNMRDQERAVRDLRARMHGMTAQLESAAKILRAKLAGDKDADRAEARIQLVLNDLKEVSDGLDRMRDLCDEAKAPAKAFAGRKQ